MEHAIKIIHILCLMGGGAAIIGNGVLMYNMMAEGGPPSALAMKSMRALGMFGLGAIVLIWITGVWLTLLHYPDGGLGWLFYAKVAVAAIVLAVVVTLSYLGARAGIEGRPANPAVMRPLSMLTFLGTITAVILAVITFG